MSAARDFNTISPSARALLLMKACTAIPYAKAAADLIWDTATQEKLVQQQYSNTFLSRVVHFENRYYTIDALLEEVQPKHIFELSSGFSFRGLHLCKQQDVFYIDTDLPDSIAYKKELLAKLMESIPTPLRGTLQLEPLNVLDEARFAELVERFPPGAVTIVNEGLLMYLDEEEKRRLCSIVRNQLLLRGGSWVTGDVYIRRNIPESERDALSEFLAYHQVEEKKFESFEAAAAFFKACGFALVKKAEAAFDRLSALQLTAQKNIDAALVKSWLKTRQTWMLVPE